jgi:hypothetical protein
MELMMAGVEEEKYRNWFGRGGNGKVQQSVCGVGTNSYAAKKGNGR